MINLLTNKVGSNVPAVFGFLFYIICNCLINIQRLNLSLLRYQRQSDKECLTNNRLVIEFENPSEIFFPPPWSEILYPLYQGLKQEENVNIVLKN